MKFLKKYRKSFLALVLAVIFSVGMLNVPGVFADEDIEKSTTENIQQNTDTDNQENNPGEDVQTAPSETEPITDNTNQDTNASSESTTEEDAPAVTAESQQAYNMTVVLDNTTLDADPDKNTSTTWKNANAKIMTVTLNRNKEVAVDANQTYVVCMKVPETFYFSGLPDISKINGAEEISIVKNQCPKVNTSSGNLTDLSGFSPYSGEIRIRLNPAVDTVQIMGIGINYNRELIGYTGQTQGISNPLSVSLVSIDNSKNLSDFTDADKTSLIDYSVKSVNIKTESIVGTGLKNSISIDEFKTNGINEQNVTLGKRDKVAYTGGTAGQTSQVYKNLTVVFSCPYVEVGNEKHYLEFDTNDIALTDNKQGNAKTGYKSGYKMSGRAQYNSDKHTITYSFENIYLGGHTVLFYTPLFSWPSDLTRNDTEYQIKGCDWEIKNPTCYTGAPATLKTSFSPTRFASYIADQVNVTLLSSDSAPAEERIAKRQIYKGVSRANNVPGALGFFDIHNKGSLDSPEVKINFDFNTEKNDQAIYYITQVNLPVYQNDSDSTQNTITVSCTLSNGKETVTKEKKYTYYSNSSSVVCKQEHFGVGSDYYIESLSYTTILKKGVAYHAETAHLYRNRPSDSGLFFGYLEGKSETQIGQTAHATMTISAADSTTPITADNKTELSSTEQSTISDKNYMAYSLPEMKVSTATSTAASSATITAGDSFTLQFGATVSNEEYSENSDTNEGKTVNGYHIFENGIFYLCLPEGVSISGSEQVTIKKSSGKTVPTENINVKELTDLGTFTVNNTNASWWKIQADGINERGGQTFTVSVQLSTALTLNDLSWDFPGCVVVRTNGQYISWGAAGTKNTPYNTPDNMKKSPYGSVQKLAEYLSSDPYKEKLGLSVYNSNTNLKVTIARAEAKLGVDTGIQIGNSDANQTSAAITTANADISYNITVSSDDGGHAENFEYYVPIVSTDSLLDTSAMVTQNEFSLILQEAVKISKVSDATDTEATIPFSVYYTTATGLTSSNIRNLDTDSWQEASKLNNNDFPAVTAIKIVTNSGAVIKDGEQYTFRVKLKYNNANKDFDHMAGSVAGWRSFGHYTYTRNNAPTTNTYPSVANQLTVCYNKDLTVDHPLTVSLNTGSSTNIANAEQELKNVTFKKSQTFKVKKVVTHNAHLITDDPGTLTGTEANSNFKMAFNINNAVAASLTENGTDSSKQWTLEPNGAIKLQTEVLFSRALTDSATDRYVDITLGNDCVTIVFRINLSRTVEAATADGSGITYGANYQVPKVSTECTIGKNSAFTALYVVNFVPGNYSAQTISWKDASNKDTVFPKGTKFTLMEISKDSAQSKVNSFWYYITPGNESKINLNSFIRMNGKNYYTYDTSSASIQTEKYMFVVDFSNAETKQGTYNFSWEATPKNISDETLSYSFAIELTSEKSYTLSVSDEVKQAVPQTTVTYTIGSAVNDSYIEHKSLALVLSKNDNTKLPEDAKIVSGDEEYTQNSTGVFIIPVKDFVTGSKTLSLVSDMFPERELSYTLTGQLYLVDSLANQSPLNGKQIGNSVTLTFNKAAENKPSLSVTGNQIATSNDWQTGQKILIQMENVEGYDLTVTAYSGLTGNQKVTDLLSSVSGIFDISNGTGTYNASKTNTKLLQLSSSASPGTYRLIFDVKDSAGKTLLQVPYYIIIK